MGKFEIKSEIAGQSMKYGYEIVFAFEMPKPKKWI
jgi:hypothetical protein